MEFRITESRWAAGSALVIALFIAAAAVLDRNLEQQIADNAFLALTLASCTVLFFSARPLRELPQLAAVVLILEAIQHFVLKAPFRVLPALALLGLASLLLLAGKTIRSVGEQRQLMYDSVVPPLLFVLLGYLGSAPMAFTDRLHPKTLDLNLYSFDQSLGLQLSLKVGQIVMPSPVLFRTMLVVYYLLPVMILLAFARLLLLNRSLAMGAFLAFVITGPLGVVFYNLLPACGPAYLLGSKFPFEPLSAQSLTRWPLDALSVSGSRNAFPSLHLAWALLVWWYAERLSAWTRIIFAIFLLGTIFATLGLGEHYFVDLVVALPFALIIQAACALNISISSTRRIAALVIGLLIVLGWVALLRSGLPLVWVSPVVPWLLVAFTIGVTLFLHARLQHAVLSRANGGQRNWGE